jgi:N-acetylmuramoyl-L-alanine amidase
MLELPSPNQDARPGGVDMLVLHYTGMQTAQAALDRLRDPAAKVSSHYVVDEDGAVYGLVPEARRAWHAGVSFWRGRRALNDGSVGIEIVNPGHEFGYRPFPAAQIAAVTHLCRGILDRHPIPPCHVVGHSDIAPDRKQDPGELFPWAELAAHGVGLWPGGADAGDAASGWDERRVRAALAAIGYDADGGDLSVLLTAFQRHWRPEQVHGEADAGTIARLAQMAGVCR